MVLDNMIQQGISGAIQEVSEEGDEVVQEEEGILGMIDAIPAVNQGTGQEPAHKTDTHHLLEDKEVR